MNRLVHILRLALVMIPALLTMATAMAQTYVYQGETTHLGVIQNPGDTYTWDIYNDSTVNFALVPGKAVNDDQATFIGGKNTGPSIDVIWHELGIYFFKVTAVDAVGCTNNIKMGIVKVIPIPIEAIAGNDTVIGYCAYAVLDAGRSVGDNLNYTWRALDVGVVINNPRQAITEFRLSSSFKDYDQLPRDFSVELTVTDDKGNSDKDTVVVTIDSMPYANVTHADELGKDGTMVVDGRVSQGTGLNYRWYTQQGQIVGNDRQPEAVIKGPGLYYLEVTDAYGCVAVKEFRFPFEDHVLVAYPDYARTSWAETIDIPILGNDYDSSNDFDLGTLRITREPEMGGVLINPDGTVTYTPIVRKAGRDHFIYEICDSINKCDTALVTIDLFDGPVWIPEGISPNGDGINETFVVRGLESYPNSEITIYTRAGQLIYQNPDYQNNWDGRSMNSRIEDGTLQPTGTYYFVLRLGGTNRFLKGFIYVAY